MIAIAAVIVSIWASQRVKRKREFEVLLEENRREAAKREQQFETEVAERAARTEAVLDTVQAEGHRAASPPAPGAGQTKAVAAQEVPGDRDSE